MPAGRKPKKMVEDDYGTSSDEGDDWEEVPSLLEAAEAHKKEMSERIPEEGLVITVPQQQHQGGKPANKYDPQEMLRLHLNRKIKRRQETLHKVTLLCGLSRTILLNEMLRSEELRGLALSMLTTKACLDQPHVLNRDYLLKVYNLIRMSFYTTSAETVYPHPRMQLAAKALAEKNFDDNESLEHLESVLKDYFMLPATRRDLNRLHKVLVTILLLRESGFDVRFMYALPTPPLRPLSTDLIKKPVQPKPVVAAEIVDGTTADDDDDKGSAVVSKTKAKKQPAKKKQSTAKAGTSSNALKKNKKIAISDYDDDDEDDYDDEGEEHPYIENPVPKNKKPLPKLALQKTNYFGCEYWVEVHIPKEAKWVSFDVVTGKLENDAELEAQAPKPMLYVIGIENDGSVKDVTRRYASRWILGGIINKRVNSDWWEATLYPFQTTDFTKDRFENRFLESIVRDKSHPNHVIELQNHPFFATPRFLKKFEAIYPESAHPAGMIKGVPFYSRHYVKTLYSREQWHRQAKSVNQDEKPYKLVKKRPKLTKENFGGWISTPKEEPLELFGDWQVGPFQPPVAKDGIVPRNNFGNVELFHPAMLPKGTVHLVLPALGRVAKKLGIDCSPALVGFEYGGAPRPIPVFDGFVVCEQFKEVLLDAWNQDQDEQVKKEEKKRRARAKGNWRKLIRGVLIKLRLSKRYPLDSAQPTYSRNLLPTPATNPESAKASTSKILLPNSKPVEKLDSVKPTSSRNLLPKPATNPRSVKASASKIVCTNPESAKAATSKKLRSNSNPVENLDPVKPSLRNLRSNSKRKQDNQQEEETAKPPPAKRGKIGKK